MFGGDDPKTIIQCNGECGVNYLYCWAYDVKHFVAVRARKWVRSGQVRVRVELKWVEYLST